MFQIRRKTVKPVVIIAISVVCSVVAVIAVQSLSGVDFSEDIRIESGELLRDRNGQEFGTQKYVMLPKIQEETWIMHEGLQLSEYLVENYLGDPTYIAECQRVWDEYLSGGDYNVELHWIVNNECRMAAITLP